MTENSVSEHLLHEDTTISSSLLTKLQQNPFWNIFLLALAWALTLTTSTLLTTIGPLSAKELGASKSMSAFTVGVFLLGAAVSSVPSGWLFRRYGRFVGFSFGCFFQLVGSVLGSLAIASNSLILLYLGCFAIGLGQGLGQFYRFSAVEITPDHLKSRAVTYVLSGGILAAFLGPTSANFSIGMVGEDYQGSYMLIAIIAILNELTIFFVKFPARPNLDSKNFNINGVSTNDISDIRTTLQIISQPLFIVSCTVATLAHTIMVMLMSNVTIDMEDNGYGFSSTSLVMELHFFAMFAPGFVSGKLIESFSTVGIAFVGVIIFAASAVVLAIGTHMWNFVLGMILVGVAWNFSFSAGTVMLTSSYRPIEATEVQAINDFILFTVAGAGSLVSGIIYADLGWLSLIYFVTGLMVVYVILFSVIWFFSIKTNETDSGAEEELLSDDELVATYGKENVLPQTERTFSSSINEYRKSHSFATYQEVDGTHDEMTPLRTISVA